MWIWLGLAALALIGELATGTFYLLLVALGLAAGGVAAWFGAGLEWELVACGVVLLLGLLVLRKTRVLKKREVDSASNADVNLDIGRGLVRQRHGARLVPGRALASRTGPGAGAAGRRTDDYRNARFDPGADSQGHARLGMSRTGPPRARPAAAALAVLAGAANVLTRRRGSES
jgi:hypothetical protein